MNTESAPVILNVRGMRCAGCVASVEEALRRAPGVTEASVNLATGEARVRGATLEPELLVEAVNQTGFSASLPAPSPADRAELLAREQRAEARAWRLRAWVALALAVASTIAAFVLPGHLAESIPLILALAAQGVIGWVYYLGAYRRLLHWSADMDTLVALGTTAAISYSVWLYATGEHAHHFTHESAVVLAFVTLGKWLESRARGQASQAVRELISKTPKTADKVVGDHIERVPVDSLALGDLFVVGAGQAVPTDGAVIDGRSTVDQSMVTGESMPVSKGPGDDVIGGSINQQGLLKVQATKIGADTMLQKMIEQVEEAQSLKPKIGRLADRVAGIFVPIVLVIALVTLLGQGFLSSDPSSWEVAIRAAVSVLVVACPCAMGLATPTAIMVATGRAASLGIHIRQARALEEGGSVDTVVIDKTGTLTEGRPTVKAVQPATWICREEFLRLLATAESASQHPLAGAIRTIAEQEGIELGIASNSSTEAGQGVEAEVDGRCVLVGRPGFLKSRNVADMPDSGAESQASIVEMGVDGKYAGRLLIADPLRRSSLWAVQELKASGVDVILASGDHAAAVHAIGSAVGLSADAIHADCTPMDKSELVRRLRRDGRIVAMVGDGINDAPALVHAHLGISMGTGSDVALESGDIVLASGDLAHLPMSLSLCRQTLRKIKQNLIWAFGYNALLIPLAALGYLPPMLSAAAMAASSVSVVANSLLLRRYPLVRSSVDQPNES